MRFWVIAIVVVVSVSSGVHAIELGQSPVHVAMQNSLNAETRSLGVTGNLANDEFGGGTRDQSETGRKSVVQAALYSAIIPGGGQYYLDRRRTARYFFGAEAGIWIAYLSFHTYGRWREDDFIAYAAAHANARLEGKSEEFQSWVGFYSSIREFNTLGRAFDPERPYLADTPENHWQWQSERERQTYRDLRNRSKEAYRRSDFMIGAAIVNRIISVVDAIRSAVRINRRIAAPGFSSAQPRPFRLSFDPLASRQICVTVYPGF
ncbi:MAG: DUF5683 domain-containing protein [Candidatus Zixiibacteriota bacterium]